MIGAIKSEIRKIFTTRLWWGLLIGVVVVDAGLSALFGSLVGQDFGGGEAAEGNPFANATIGTAQLVYSAGFIYLLSPLFPLVLGVILITSEFRHQTVSATFLATPERWKVVVAKLVAILGIGTVYAVIHDIAVVAGGATVMSARGYPTFLDNSAVWQTLALSVLCFVCWALLGFGFGILIRNQVAAIMVALGVAFVAQIALQIVFGVLDWPNASKWLPSNLSTGMLVTNDPTAGQASAGDNPYFNWWQSALTLTAYALALTGIGSWLTARRDVS